MTVVEGCFERTARIWVAVGGTAVVRFCPMPGVSVVMITGLLDTAALQPCRAALDVATECRGPIIMDLERVAPPVSVSVALLGAMRRYVMARGATLTLTAIPWQWEAALQRAGVRGLYESEPSLAKALQRPDRR